jgi:hypothetical protein
LTPGTVDGFDQTFKPATLDGGFSELNIPAGFVPLYIANIDNNLFVIYAKKNAQKNATSIDGCGRSCLARSATSTPAPSIVALQGRTSSTTGCSARSWQNPGLNR